VCEHDRNSDFADGFKVGYVDVCRGGDGKCPAVPPSYYWDSKFQCAVGAERLETWYRGFVNGAGVAMGTETKQACADGPTATEAICQNTINGAKNGVTPLELTEHESPL